MTDGGSRGGEPGGARLLALARRELLDVLLPQLQGEARYRARLIANALRLAAAELDGEPLERLEALQRLQGLATAVGGTEVSALSGRELEVALAAALRGGRLDGHQAFYQLLCELTEMRRRPLD